MALLTSQDLKPSKSDSGPHPPLAPPLSLPSPGSSPPILYTSCGGSLRGLLTGRVGGRMESRASSRVTPVACPSFRSTFQPLNQGICGDRSAVEGEARWGRGSWRAHPGTKTHSPLHPGRPWTPPALTHVGAGLQRVVSVPARDGHKGQVVPHPKGPWSPTYGVKPSFCR